MLVRQGDERSLAVDRHLAWWLAGIAGGLNAAGFYAVGLYSSNMTGNVSALADHVALADFSTGLLFLAIVCTFILGAAISALLINAGRRRGLAGIYAYSILAEAVLLAGLAMVDLWLTGGGRGPLLVFGLAFLMGLQNAVVTRLSNARVRTTHVTGMVTDIGIELGNLLDNAWHRRRRDVEEFNREKLRLHAETVLCFLAGGILGVLAYREVGGWLLMAAAAMLLVLALPAIFATRVRDRRQHG
ncbi:hypothetical protein HMPREF9946_03847 [Acetobacteraceae bacterium AT-5844]|nr:hypothetical protein HMPREF9946_03847 [Acetobacteraceae bacterium AT-5844]